ncbi:MAG: hypothetical protein HZA74_08575 [Ignavibacteriales bacterium]|nr:hypothetical protein [Ignavibacteriales bacterium]
MKPALSILLIVVTIVSLSCQHTTEPELQPGRRDYVWTVDTIKAPHNVYLHFWGDSPNNIWGVSSGSYLSVAFAHYDGNKWVTYPVVSGMDSPVSIWGFNSNNIFVGTSDGCVWNYNGYTWNNFYDFKKNGQKQIVLQNIWGESANDFYVCGAYPDSAKFFNNSFIAHYHNQMWTLLDTKNMKGIVGAVYKNSKTSKLYAIVYKLGGLAHPDSSIIYEYNNGEFKKIYKSLWVYGLQSDIQYIKNEVYFVLGNQVAKRIGNQFQTYLMVNDSKFYQRIWGRNSNDIFLLMTDGLAHYNGSDIVYLFHFNKPMTQIFSAVLFENDVFFYISETSPNLNLVYHGKLTQGGE